MSEKAKIAPALLCPSATVIDADAQVFGVLTGSAAEGLQVGDPDRGGAGDTRSLRCRSAGQGDRSIPCRSTVP